MVEAVLVSGRGHQHHAFAMGIRDGFLSEVRVIVGTNGGHGNPGPDVHRIDEPLREVVDIHDEAVPDPDRQQGGMGGHPDPSQAIIPLGGSPLRGAGPVMELHVVEGIVIVLEEVPAVDIVDIAIAIVIDAVAEDGYEIPGIEDLVAVNIEDPRVVGVILNIEYAIAIDIEDPWGRLPVGILGLGQFPLLR